MEKLVLIDGNSLINRAYYATPLLTDKSGRPTNAILGFTNMLIKMRADLSPDYLLVAFDRHEPTFRHKIFESYKGTRKPMPDDLRLQIPLLKELLNAMNIRTYEQAGIEADDIIGTIAKRYGGKTIIITGDKDSFQLVDDNVSVYFTKRGISDVEIYTSENFQEKTGILPSQVIDLKACMGDSSDNIPGIAGIGEKTALTLIQKYGGLDGVISHAEELKGKLSEKVINGKESAYLSRTLATINVHADIPENIEKSVFPFPFGNEVKKLFESLDFKGILRRTELFGADGANQLSPEKSEIQVKIIKKAEDFTGIPSGNEITLAVLKDIHVFNGDNTEYVIKIAENMMLDDGLSYEEGLELFREFVENAENTVICYSRKKLDDIFYDAGINFNCKAEDLDLVRYLADFSGREETLEETLEDYGENKNTPAFSLYSLYTELYKKLKEDGTEKLYRETELPLSRVLTAMERAGFKIDIKMLDELKKEYSTKLKELSDKINEYAGEPVNPNSPKQLATLLYEKLGLSKGKKNKSGNYTTSAETLEALADKHPVVPLILSYRTAQKLYSSYIEGMRPLIDVKTGLVHTCFNQTLTQTGRLSSKEPNLQNIPVREDEGRVLRKLFIPRSENRTLIDADYSQIELRLLAHMSGCEELIGAYNEGKDVHAVTASQVFGVPITEVTPQMRRSAKAVNFGIIYGISEYGLAKNLKISAKEAADYIKKYFETYPHVKEYMEKNVEFAKKHGYVTTLFGRKRIIKELSSSNYAVRTFGERAAMNMPLQGTSADIIKIAMINVFNRLKKECPDAYLILQVHDELIIDAPDECVAAASKILKYEMENAVKLKVPLTVELSTGKTWYDAK